MVGSRRETRWGFTHRDPLRGSPRGIGIRGGPLGGCPRGIRWGITLGESLGVISQPPAPTKTAQQHLQTIPKLPETRPRIDPESDLNRPQPAGANPEPTQNHPRTPHVGSCWVWVRSGGIWVGADGFSIKLSVLAFGTRFVSPLGDAFGYSDNVYNRSGS